MTKFLPTTDWRALIEWEERRDRGEVITPEILCGECPEFIAELGRRIHLLEEWDRLPPRALAGPRADVSIEITEGNEVRESAEFLARLSRLEFHARGGLGVVYKAWHDELQRFVAVKFLRKQHATDSALRARFLKEAEITAQLEHPGIVAIYGIGQDANAIPCYVMRFIQGPTMEESIREFHATTWPDTGERHKKFRDLLGHFIAAVAAVAYAHGRNVLHRDLKPINMILGPLGQIVVLDWGLGKSPSTSEGSARLTADENAANPRISGFATEGRMGTLGYMSPEQQAGDWPRVDARSDVFSLGVTLYFLLTGKAPFSGGSPAEILQNVEGGEFKPPRQLEPTIDRALEAICLKAMSFHPENRYPTALELVEDLKNWTADEPVSAVLEHWYDRWARTVRRHRVAAMAAVLMLATIAVAATVTTVFTSLAQRAEHQALAKAESARNLAFEAIQKFREAVRDNLDVRNRPDLGAFARHCLRSR